jgi:6-phosphogluconolactonase
MSGGKYELVRFPAAEELARAAAEQWLAQFQRSATPEGPYCVGLSGGRIARTFYTSVVKSDHAQVLKSSRLHFFWGDERCVPPTDSESNFVLARELLLEPLAIANDQIHRIRGEADPKFAADEAEAELCRIAPLDDDGQPVMELIFLGMGEDGHVASLFPGEPESVMANRAVYRPVTASKPPPQRITISYRALSAARQVWVLASGPGKEKALRASLEARAKTPLGRIINARENTRVFTDVPL